MEQITQIFFLASVLALCLAKLTLFIMEKGRKWLKQREQTRTVPCTSCNTLIYASALSCFNCGAENKNPRRLGFFGQTIQQPVLDLNLHQKELLIWHRCPVCAAYFEEKAFHQHCSMCGVATLPNAESVKQYLQVLRWEKPEVVSMLFIFGLIPVLGTILALIYYHHSFIASMYNFVPDTRGRLQRRICTLVGVLLIAFQPIPVLGAFALPLMVISNIWVYQTFLECESGILFGWFGERSPANQPVLFSTLEPKPSLQHVHLEPVAVAENVNRRLAI